VYDVLFHIPHQVGGIPVFGWGLAALAWLVAGGGWIAWQSWRSRSGADAIGGLALLGLGAAALVWLAPRMEEAAPTTNAPLGIAIHGYGVMVTLGVVVGVALALREALRMGLDVEFIHGLAMRLFLFGIAGARALYVALNWDDYMRPTWRETVVEIAKFTQGGLVVYGAFVGAMVAGALYVRARRQPLLAVADLITPAMLAGLALGRVGCFLHGCCFGGECPAGPLAVSFPMTAPPYFHQLVRGRFHGLWLAPGSTPRELLVQRIDPDSPAAKAGLTAGARLRRVNGFDINTSSRAWLPFSGAARAMEVETADGRMFHWTAPPPPPRSLPVHPVQLYSAASAAALCLLLWAWYPFRRRDGELIAGLLLLYPLTRILEEAVRDDEPGRFGTVLTISQWVSVVLLLAGAALAAYLAKRPPGCVRFVRAEPA
jgi:phosphatidylglycerol:prolipoprotein diacylglycerol transferase